MRSRRAARAGKAGTLPRRSWAWMTRALEPVGTGRKRAKKIALCLCGLLLLVFSCAAGSNPCKKRSNFTLDATVLHKPILLFEREDKLLLIVITLERQTERRKLAL